MSEFDLRKLSCSHISYDNLDIIVKEMADQFPFCGKLKLHQLFSQSEVVQLALLRDLLGE